MATTEKLSLALEKESLAWARAQAKREGLSLSALVSGTLQRAKQRQAWSEYLTAALKGQPPLSEAELEKADRLLADLDPPMKVKGPSKARAATASAPKNRRRAG